MNEKSINEQYASILAFLKKGRLKEALTQLEAFLGQCPNLDLRMQLEQVQMSYKYLLDYMRQGIKDPERWNLHRKLTADAWEIADHAHIFYLDKISSKYYHEMRRFPAHPKYGNLTLRQLSHTLESFQDDLAVSGLLSEDKMNEVLKRHEDTLKHLFIRTWTHYAWTAEEDEDAHALLQSKELITDDLCLFTSAVMLGAADCFDLRKINWLFDAYSHPSAAVAQRAITGILIVFHQHADRLTLYPELNQRMKLMEEHPTFAKDLEHVYRQMLLCQETEKIDKKMREEIIPEVLKKTSSMKNLRWGADENEEEKDDLNPDWQDEFENSTLGNMMREMSEMQAEGADVYMSTFSSLKNYPFFHHIANWFYPFTEKQSDMHRALKMANSHSLKNSLLNVILQSGFFSNSDKYSFIFTISQLPAAQQGMLFQQMSTREVESLQDKENVYKLEQFNQSPATISRQYLHDLYRFYKLNTHRADFTDIFKQKLAFHRIPLFKEMLMKKEVLLPIAGFLLKKGRWTDAIELFGEMEQLPFGEENQVEFYQKFGYALQKEKRFEEALRTYHKADILKPGNSWTNRHLATCYRMTQAYEQALHYYRKVEEIQPDNANVIYYIGHCLTEMKKQDEALNYFFKLDFIEKSSVRAWRGIGWCSFVCGKYEQAKKYYEKAIEQNPLAIDYMNSGHVSWAMGHIEEAATAYGKAVIASGTRQKFDEMFENDKEVLVEQGIPRQDIPLMLDLI